MRVLGTLAGVALILLTLIDGFETILQPRRVTHRFRYARLFYRSTWRIWRFLALRFSVGKRREAVLALMDARAGSPPSAGQLLLRAARSGSVTQIEEFLAEWELWAAELLESHLSFPVLSYYRSQHDNQSWLAVLTTILDTTALLMVAVEEYNSYRAQLTFAMARHAAVDLALVLRTKPLPLP